MATPLVKFYRGPATVVDFYHTTDTYVIFKVPDLWDCSITLSATGDIQKDGISEMAYFVDLLASGSIQALGNLDMPLSITLLTSESVQPLGNLDMPVTLSLSGTANMEALRALGIWLTALLESSGSFESKIAIAMQLVTSLESLGFLGDAKGNLVINCFQNLKAEHSPLVSVVSCLQGIPFSERPTDAISTSSQDMGKTIGVERPLVPISTEGGR